MDLAQGANWYANRVIERMTHQPRPGDVRAEIRDILQEAYIAGARRQQQSKDDSDENAHLCGMCKHWYSGVACPDCVPDETEQANGRIEITWKMLEAMYFTLYNLPVNYPAPVDGWAAHAKGLAAALRAGGLNVDEDYWKEHPAQATITVNCVERTVTGHVISYEQVAILAGNPGTTHLMMTYHHSRGGHGGCLIPGEWANLRDGMHFTVVNTSNA
jgi:hypothetical protein